jgi:glutamine amidotransferase/cyclase
MNPNPNPIYTTVVLSYINSTRFLSCSRSSSRRLLFQVLSHIPIYIASILLPPPHLDIIPYSIPTLRRSPPSPLSGTAICYHSQMSAVTVSLLDYGAGNVRSVRNAIHALGYQIIDIKTIEDINSASCIVFPGVGRFGSCMNFLREKKFVQPLREYILADRPFFGICVGFQALFQSSEESPGIEGLSIIPGVVTRFEMSNLPVPHMGWSTLQLQNSSTKPSIYSSRVYFVHSFCALATTDNQEWTFTTTDYGRRFISSIKKGHVMGTQFHPEKSGKAGLNILKEFLQNALLSGEESQTNNKEEVLSDSSGVTGTVEGATLAKRIVACLDVRSNDNGDLVVTKGDQYDVREEGVGDDDIKEGGGTKPGQHEPVTKKQKVCNKKTGSDVLNATTSNNSGRVRNLGKPRDLAKRYYEEGADEIVFLNITSFRSSPMSDQPLLNLLRETSKSVFVPLTIGGGIRNYKDTDGHEWTALDVASQYFRAGADKVSIGSDAVHAAAALLSSKDGSTMTGSSSIEQISHAYGAQAVVVSVDPRRSYLLNEQEKAEHEAMGHAVFDSPKGSPGPYMWYQCTVSGGRQGSNIGAVQLGRAVELLGAGELLCNCVDADGQKNGFEVPLLRALSDAVSIPVIASSGAGTPEHFEQIFRQTNVTAALAAGIFHRNEVPLGVVKDFLEKCDGINIRN